MGNYGRWVLIQGFFTLSGACALAYEIVWGRWLVTVLGGSAMAAGAILTSYMGGLALGSWLFGRLSRSTSSPLKVYVLVEMGIGLLALFFPYFSTAILGLPGPLRMTLAMAALLAPTVLMGGTVPLVMAWSEDAGLAEGSTLGRLYGLNTLGAAVGCLSAGLLLIPSLGLQLTNVLAALANLLIALMVYLICRSDPAATPGADDAPAASTSPSPTVAPGAGRWLLHLIAFISGMVTLGLEVIWIRLLRITLGSTTYTFTFVITTFVMGIGLGGLLAGRTPEDAPVSRRLAISQAILLCLLALQFLLLPHTPALSQLLRAGSFDWSAAMVSSALICVVALLPATFVVGYMFPLLGRLYMRRGHRGRQIGILYAVNTVGAVAGSLLTTLAFIPGLGSAASYLLLTGMMFISLAGYGYLARARLSRWFPAIAGAIVVLVAVLAVARPGWTPEYMGRGAYLEQEAGERKVLHFHEGRNSTVLVEDFAAGRGLWVDGKPVASSVYIDYCNQVLLGHLPAVLHPAPRTGLVVGLGTGMTLGSLAEHELEHLEVVELEAGLVDAARFFGEYNHEVLDRPELRVIIDDGFNHLHGTELFYEVITSDPIQPYFRGAATLYSVNYFSRVRERLTEDGIMAHWLPLANMSVSDFKLIVRTFTEVFPYARLYWTGATDTILVGRQVPWEDPAVVRSQYEMARADLEQIFIEGPEEMESLLIADRELLRRWAGEGLVNEIDLPSLEFSAPRALHIDTVFQNLGILLKLRRGLGRPGPAERASDVVLAYNSGIRRIRDRRLVDEVLYGAIGCPSGPANCDLVRHSGMLRRILWERALGAGDAAYDRHLQRGRLRQSWWYQGPNTGMDAQRPGDWSDLKLALAAYEDAAVLASDRLSEEGIAIGMRARTLLDWFPESSPEGQRAAALKGTRLPPARPR